MESETEDKQTKGKSSKLEVPIERDNLTQEGKPKNIQVRKNNKQNNVNGKDKTEAQKEVQTAGKEAKNKDSSEKDDNSAEMAIRQNVSPQKDKQTDFVQCVTQFHGRKYI